MKTEQNSVVPQESKGLPPTPNMLDDGLQDRRDWWIFFLYRVMTGVFSVFLVQLSHSLWLNSAPIKAVRQSGSACWIVSGYRASTAELALLFLPTHRVLALPESSLPVWSMCGVF